jgi:hypothetical protein
MKSLVLESAKGVRNGKIQLCFSQIVETGRTNSSVLGLLNASDERFAQQKPRYAWMTAEPADVLVQFGIDVSGLAEGDVLEIGMVDPRLASNPDVALNLQIVETTEGTEYDVANFETRAKRAGKDGDFILSEGKYIYVNTTIVAGAPVHKIFTETTRESKATDLISQALGE